MTTAITKDDEGKRVVEADGAEIGVVADVRHGTAHVEAEPSVVEKMKQELSAGGSDENTYALSEDAIEKIEDDRVVLQTRG
ncbi:PRC-barrel domain containing protein [Haladaptatus caseinilyticus]|uniref:PRC-barrel domain containing protein n=1 Tax=Haladaptatus caseinilyticus TaxID=2993314 RepID=UPI00224A67BE|nr:PRC-barrel domain containing protein [Haladaptatus caseinilyticus]